MRLKQRRIFLEYNAMFAPDIVAKWTKMVEEWNSDPNKPDPYEEPMTGMVTLLQGDLAVDANECQILTGLTMAAVKLELAQQEAVEASHGQLPMHEVMPAVFLQVGLELEEQQCIHPHCAYGLGASMETFGVWQARTSSSTHLRCICHRARRSTNQAQCPHTED